MSFYTEYLAAMGDERLVIERDNIAECLKIASRRVAYSPDVERLTWKASDIRREMLKRGLLNSDTFRQCTATGQAHGKCPSVRCGLRADHGLYHTFMCCEDALPF